MTAKPTYEELERRVQELETTNTQLENKLHEARSLTEEVMTCMSEGLVLTDTSASIVFINKSLSEMLGYMPEEIIGKCWLDIVPAEQQAIAKKAEDRRSQGHTDRYEIILHRKNGKKLPVLIGAGPRFDKQGGQYIGSMGVVTDITDRKRAEEMLKASEAAVRNKLKAIIGPERDLKELELADIIDVPAVQSLMENFHRITGMLSAIVDSNGKVLVDVGWQDICTKFHRCYPETQKNCVESDTALSCATDPGDFKSYRCKNGMWDMSSPIVVSGLHMGNIYFGQFIYSDEELDVERFRNQARRYRFDEVEYLSALNRVPRYDRETVGEVMAFYSKLAKMISALSFSNVRLSRTLTEQKLAEEALKEKTQLLQNITDNMFDLVSLTDMKGNFTFLGASHKILNYNLDSLIGKNVLEFVHPEDLPEISFTFNDFLSRLDDNQKVEYRYRRADGTYIWLETVGRFIRDNKGGPSEILFSSRDITERKKAEESSKRLKDRLESLWNITKIADSDIKTISDHVLAEVQKMTQSEYAFYGFLDKNENKMILHAWSDQTINDCRTNETPLHFAIDKAGIWAQAVKVKKPLIINDFLLDHPGKKGLPDGHVQITRLMAVPLIKERKVTSIAAVANKSDPYSIEDEKQVQAFLGNVQLLIDRKTAEQDKIDLMIRIQQMQKMESIGNLAGGIAHDFNNLLFPIVGLSEMMLNDFPPDSMERQNIQEIFNAGTRGRELVQQILSFGRQAEHRQIPVYIQEILNEVLKLCRATIPADIPITPDIQLDCGPVMADPTQVHQIAMNLITNAYHAVESTGGTITVQLKETDFIHDDNPALHMISGRYAVLAVLDTGTGIDPAVMNKIFDPYFTTKEKGRGTGLGLATVYGIVKTHEGDIRVHSEVGKGSSFHVYLPVLGKSADVSPEKQQQPLPTGTEHILLVDDEAPIVQMEQQMLERLGYRITCFSSSVDALAAFRTDPSCFDLIITDMNMPNLNGMQLAEKLTAVRPDILVIICTGFSERINKENAAGMGISGLLMKPVVMKDLAQKVREVLDTMNE